MATFKCKMCGGDIQAETGAAFGTCGSCGVTSTLPKANEERLVNLFNRANHFRRLNEFDKAIAIYENILNEDSTNAEAHWCVVLCRYGIEYVEDPKTYQRVPTCHRTQFAPILTDADYLAALENAQDSYTKGLYEAEAKKISEIQKGILAISSQEQPYDIFICYKETTDGGSRTKDSTIAQDIYYQLTDDYKVFFAKIILEDKLGQEYEPYIFNALNSAKVMLVLGTKKEHFEAVWVKNEWSRFLALMKNDRSRLLIPCYRDMDAYDIPDELAHFQALDMGKIGFVQDLVRGVGKVLAIKAQVPHKTLSEENLYADLGLSEEDLARVKRGFIFLEDGDWEKAKGYFEYAAEMGYVPAYLGLIAARWERSLESVKQLMADSPQFISDINDMAQVVRFESMYVAQSFLMAGKWDEADAHYDAVLDKDPEYGQAYIGKLKAEIGIVVIDELAEASRFSRCPANYSNYKNALRFSTQEQREQLEKYNQAIIDQLAVKKDLLIQMLNDSEQYSFQMPIDSVASTSKHETVVYGIIKTGMLGVPKRLGINIDAEIVGKSMEPKKTAVVAVMVADKPDATVARSEDKIGIILKDVAVSDISVGQILRGVSLSEYVFYMPIEDLYERTSKSVSVCGRIECGVIYTGDKVEINDRHGGVLTASVDSMFTAHNIMPVTTATGGEVVITIKGVIADDIKPGHVLCIKAVAEELPEDARIRSEAAGQKLAQDMENMKHYFIREEWWEKFLCGHCGGKIGLIVPKCKKCGKTRNSSDWKIEVAKKYDLAMAMVQRHREWCERGFCYNCGHSEFNIGDKCKMCLSEQIAKSAWNTVERKIIKRYDAKYDRGFSKEDYNDQAKNYRKSKANNNTFSIGQTVFAMYESTNSFYPGTISNMAQDSFTISFLVDDYEETVEPHNVIELNEAYSILKLKGNWKNYGTWYGCKVIKTEPLTVKYDDGMSEKVKLKQLCGTLK